MRVAVLSKGILIRTSIYTKIPKLESDVVRGGVVSDSMHEFVEHGTARILMVPPT